VQLQGVKVLILILGHLATAPRPQKEAKALREAGATVHVRGAWWSSALAQEDVLIAKEMDVDFAPVIDLRLRTITSFVFRLRQRIARELYSRFGHVTSRVFGLGAPELLREAKRIPAAITIVHSETGLWVGKKLLDEGYRVGVDFEDWFSHDLLPADRKERPVAELQALERYMLKHAHCCYTTSKVLAQALANDAGTDRIPECVPNCFPAESRAQAIKQEKDVIPEGVVSFHWFSQTIGPGRGLEALAQVLPKLKGDWQVSLRGNISGYQEWFNATFPESIRSRVKILETVPNSDLLARTMSHDVGLALEIPFCESRDLTATNKIFEYLRAGLAIIGTRTKGQLEVMQECPGAGMLVAPDDAEQLATAMQRMLDDEAYLRSCRHESAEAGKTIWSWEQHAPTLLRAITEGLAQQLPE